MEDHVVELGPDGRIPALLLQTGKCHRIIVVRPTLSDLHFAVVSRSGGLMLCDAEITVTLRTGPTRVQPDDRGHVLVESVPAGDYDVHVQLGTRSERCSVPTTPPGTDPLLIPMSFPFDPI